MWHQFLEKSMYTQCTICTWSFRLVVPYQDILLDLQLTLGLVKSRCVWNEVNWNAVFQVICLRNCAWGISSSCIGLNWSDKNTIFRSLSKMLIFLFMLAPLPLLTSGEGWTWTCDSETSFCRKWPEQFFFCICWLRYLDLKAPWW